MLFVGIDPSLTSTGIIGLNENGEVKIETTIKSKPIGDTPLHELQRIRDIVRQITEEVLKEEPNHVCIEGLAFMARNTQSLIQLAALNYFIRWELAKAVVPWSVITPSSNKKFGSGKGNTHKDQMIFAVYDTFGYHAKNADLCDAYSLAQLARGLHGHGKWNAMQKEVIQQVGPYAKK